MKRPEDKTPLSLSLYESCEPETLAVPKGTLAAVRLAVEAALAYEGVYGETEVSLTLCDGEYIRALNAEYRGKDSATDVLSFPLFDFEGETEEPPIDEVMSNLGDIVISLEKAKEQAEEFGHSFERETAFLCVHSMLHLLGYDHERSEEEDVEMRSKQSEIMKIMGLEVK
jgi:probable rRNA maturation factor